LSNASKYVACHVFIIFLSLNFYANNWLSKPCQ
jgi:hypothetical protein